MSSLFLQERSEPSLSGQLLVPAAKPGQFFASMRPFGYKSRKEPIRSSSVQVRRESKDHATLSDLYLNNVISRLTHISEDSARLLKRVRGGVM